MPNIVNKYLESIRAMFFLGTDSTDRRIHWEGVTASKQKGGLEIGTLEAFNKALHCKENGVF